MESSLLRRWADTSCPHSWYCCHGRGIERRWLCRRRVAWRVPPLSCDCDGELYQLQAVVALVPHTRSVVETALVAVAQKSMDGKDRIVPLFRKFGSTTYLPPQSTAHPVQRPWCKPPATTRATGVLPPLSITSGQMPPRSAPSRPC